MKETKINISAFQVSEWSFPFHVTCHIWNSLWCAWGKSKNDFSLEPLPMVPSLPGLLSRMRGPWPASLSYRVSRRKVMVWIMWVVFLFVGFVFSFGSPVARGVPGPGLRSELQLQPKTQLWQCRILGPPCGARDWPLSQNTADPVVPQRELLPLSLFTTFYKNVFRTYLLNTSLLCTGNWIQQGLWPQGPPHPMKKTSPQNQSQWAMWCNDGPGPRDS